MRFVQVVAPTLVVLVVLFAAQFLILPRWLRGRVGYGPVGPAPGACATRNEVFVPVPMAVAHQLTLQALDQVKARIASDEPHRICATRGFSWRSFAEVITVWLWVDDGGTHVLVESRSALGTTLVDWGQNRANVDAVLRHIWTGAGASAGATWATA